VIYQIDRFVGIHKQVSSMVFKGSLDVKSSDSGTLLP